jgi:ribonuclease HI
VKTTVYTDGACSGNPGPGGWAWAVIGGAYESGAAPRTTNQRMEIRAVLEALRSNAGELDVLSDSTYVVNCFRDRWWERWLEKGWVTSARKPVVNRDLWEPLIELYIPRARDVSFGWVKGHHTDTTNELADRLAVEAARTQQGRSGSSPPLDLGVADERGRDMRLPPGRLVLVAGHRPPELGGYADNPVARRAREQLVEVLLAKRDMHPDLVVLTGLGLGAEQLGAEAAARAGVPYVAVLAYPDQDSVWPSSSRERYTQLLAGAERTVLLQIKPPPSRQQAGAALKRRDAWLVRQADEAIVVWDGEEANVGRLARSLEDKLGEDVWILDPAQ